MLEYTRKKIRQNCYDTRHLIGYRPKKGHNRVLIVQMEGIGNAILTTPLIKALKSMNKGFDIDVLLNRKRGSTIAFENWFFVTRILDINDLQGRNGHYQYVFECHPRKDLPLNIKYSKRYRISVKPKPDLEYHWWFEKHESEYLLDMARKIGFTGKSPRVRKLAGYSNHTINVDVNTVAIGIGYFKGKRPDGRDWRDRHWGNEHFKTLCDLLKKNTFKPVLVGDVKDNQADGQVLESYGVENICGKISLEQLVGYLSDCAGFIGNDTGLMHVAASLNIPTIGLFVHTNSIKSYPLGDNTLAIGGDCGDMIYKIEPADVFKKFINCIESAAK